MNDISAEEVENKLKELQEWIRYQPELPQNFGTEINIKYFFKLYHFRYYRKSFALEIPESCAMASGESPASRKIQRRAASRESAYLQQSRSPVE